MAFPINPTNGQQTTENGIVYTYNSTLGVWAVGSTSGTALSANTLAVSNSATIGTTLAVTGAANLSSTLSVTGAITTTNGIADIRAPANAVLFNVQENSSGNNRRIRFLNSSTVNTIESTTGTGSTILAFSVDGTERARIDSSGHFSPGATNTYDLGTSSLRWRNIYTNDLQLSNGIGDYTIVEGEQDLFLYNNKTNKTFKFALIEVDPNTVPPKANTE
jgi:hypothetical protein